MNSIDPVECTMWKDLDAQTWETEAGARTSNLNILKRREHRRKERMIERHVEIAFNDWLRYTEQDKACDMRQGAMKLVYYLINKDLLKPEVFDE